MLQLIIVFYLTLVAETAEVKTSIVNIKYDYKCDEEFIKVYASHKVTLNDYFVNITFDIQKPFTSVKIHPRLSLKKDAFDKNYDLVALSTSINVCNKNDFMKTTMVLRSMVDTFAAGLLDDMSCPYKKSIIRLQNCQISSIVLPPMVPNTKFKLWGKMTATEIGSKKVIKLCSLNIYAEHRRPT